MAEYHHRKINQVHLAQKQSDKCHTHAYKYKRKICETEETNKLVMSVWYDEKISYFLVSIIIIMIDEMDFFSSFTSLIIITLDRIIACNK